MVQRIAVVGGGPGGLFFATLVARALPGVAVTLFERNARTDAFGFGVVFSDATLRAIDDADPVLRDALRESGTHWDRIRVRVHGEEHGFSGNGMAAIHRKILLRLLQRNAEDAGVDLRFATTAPPTAELAASYDLVVGSDGTNSGVRQHLAGLADLGHTVEEATAKFVWFGTTHLFESLTFLHRESEHGPFAVHGYPISGELSTFIVETDPDTWLRAGMDRFDVTAPPGPSDTDTQVYLEKLFADDIGGAPLVANNSRWGNFRTRRSARWHHDNVVLLGDAVHTAHFSVGSGTKMAMEDAVVLAAEVAGAPDDLPGALARYQEARARAVGRIQDAARPSLSWWEHFGAYQRELDPLTFAFHFFSRSIDVDAIAERDPALVASVRQAWRDGHGADALDTPLELSGLGPASRGRRLGAFVDAGGVTLTEAGDVLAIVAADHLVVAPADPREVAAAAALLPDSGVVAVTGGTALTRVLLSEEARLRRGLTSVLVLDASELRTGADPAAHAETLVLAGRADAVAYRQDSR